MSLATAPVVDPTLARYTEALFVARLDRLPSETDAQIRAAVERTLETHGEQQCVERMATVFGDESEYAANRMCRARADVLRVFKAELAAA